MAEGPRPARRVRFHRAHAHGGALTSIWAALDAELASLESAGLRRSLRTAGGPAEAEITLDGRRLVNFSSNNYLGLANHPEVVAAARAGLDRWGAGSGGSRLTSGNQAAYGAVETALAEWKGCEAAVVFPTGYAAACGTIPALAGEGDAVCVDRLNHASLIDGCRLSKARLLVYPHADAGALGELLAKRRAAYRRVLIVTDGLFSMDGDIAPLPDLLAVAGRHDATVLVDDAHATGVLGATGAGTAEHFGVPAGGRLVQMGTLSKALGSVGGFIAGPSTLREWLINRARTLIYSTGLPAASLEAARTAIGITRRDGARRTRLTALSRTIRDGARKAGLNVPGGETPIIPVLLGDPAATVRAGEAALAAGCFVPGIRPPTVPEGTSRLRVSVMADHTETHVARLLDALAGARTAG